MSQQPSHKKVVAIIGAVIVGMFAFCFAMVPLYNKICRATGINTTIRSSEWSKPVALSSHFSDANFARDITVQFVAVTHENLGWDFYPYTKSMQVHPGMNNTVTFYAKNNTDKNMIVQAIPSMTPSDAIAHFHKIECFCFRQQSLEAGHKKDMKLVFQI